MCCLSAEGDVYDVMLNQTNVEFNNNKYYLLQLAKANNRNQYYVWFRWGRVGKKGRNNLIPCADDLDKAKGIFKQKFFDKTCNEFDERHGFVKVKGKYDLVQVCADETDPQVGTKEVLLHALPTCEIVIVSVFKHRTLFTTCFFFK